jgi:hypothetical protein
VATNSVPRGEWAVRLTTVGTGIGLRLLRYSSKVSIVLDGVTC